MRLVKPSVQLITTWGSEELLCALIDVVYRGLSIDDALMRCKDDELRQRRLRRLVENGHYSVLEFAGAVWLIECSRVCTHQLVRHRIASYLQESQRYVNYTKQEIRVIDMPGLNIDVVKQAIEAYESAVKSGVKPEDARYVLPNAVASRIIVQMNLREFLINFLPLRTSPKAQHEIRVVAFLMLSTIADKFPIVTRHVLRVLERLHPEACNIECLKSSMGEAFSVFKMSPPSLPIPP